MSGRLEQRALDGDWVDELLFPGSDPAAPCLHLGAPIERAVLRRTVHEHQSRLAEIGVRRGDTVALQLPPSLALIADLLATWRTGAQAILLDHRLTEHEVERALERVAPRFVVRPTDVPRRGALRGFHDVTSAVYARPGGRPVTTGHALIQLSSGSTGPSKVIGRTAEELVTEVHRYTRIEGMPQHGHRVVVLNSLIHAMGLIGGLLHSLHVGAEIVLAERMTADGILAATGARTAPTVIMGVPFHAQLLGAVTSPPALPHLVRAISAGEVVRPKVAAAFADRYQVPLGEVYGMTEMGVIATDLSGANRPATGWPAPGIEVRVAEGELLVGRAASPYVGLTDPSRWADGWLRTRDAAEIDQGTGLVTIRGRLDSQVSVGGLKVDLTEVEGSLLELPAVREAVVIHDGVIEAYLTVRGGTTGVEVEKALAERIAGFKLPRQFHVVAELPKTTTGKPVRDLTALRAAAGRAG